MAFASAPASDLPALDPHKPPSENFDLTHWYIQLPVDSSGGFDGEAIIIKTPELSAGYSRPPFFFTGKDGAMVFECPFDGAARHGNPPRCELRETHPDGALYNWTPPSDGGTHILDGVCVVNAVGKGKVAIGQIHGKEPDIPTVILRYDNTKAAPRIYVTVKKNPADPKSQDTLVFDGVPLDAPITYQLKMVATENSLMFYCTVNGVTQSQDMYASSPDWLTVTHYFKAGAYYTVPEPGQTARVSFYKLAISHSGEGHTSIRP